LQIIDLPIGWTVVLDSIAWAVIQPTIAYFLIRLPTSAFDPGWWLFQTRNWERGGTIYASLFLVKRWKSLLPSGGTVFEGGFSMRHIVSRRKEYLEHWIRETCRAELTHWIALIASGLFYAVLVNMPCVIVQRYNRPRLAGMLYRRLALCS